jgi:hypothetical protein
VSEEALGARDTLGSFSREMGWKRAKPAGSERDPTFRFRAAERYPAADRAREHPLRQTAALESVPRLVAPRPIRAIVTCRGSLATLALEGVWSRAERPERSLCFFPPAFRPRSLAAPAC